MRKKTSRTTLNEKLEFNGTFIESCEVNNIIKTNKNTIFLNFRFMSVNIVLVLYYNDRLYSYRYNTISISDLFGYI